MPPKSDEALEVLVAVDVSEDLLQRIREVSPRLTLRHVTGPVADDDWARAEIVYTGRTLPTPDQAPGLRWVQLLSAGMDRILDHPIAQGEVIITSTSGIHAQQMANYCLMMMLAFNYKLPRMIEYQRRGIWPDDRGTIFRPRDMHRQTLGIVGYGSIGRELARLAKTLGMTLLATKRDIKQPAETTTDYTPEGTGDPQGELPDRFYPIEALAAMVADCDYVVVTVPLTTQTHHLMDAPIFDAMSETAVLVNVARGAVVDEAALIQALQQQRIGGAALDVFENEPLPLNSPLWSLDNVILSPHISGNSEHYQEKAVEVFIANLKRYLAGRPLLNRLDQAAGY